MLSLRHAAPSLALLALAAFGCGGGGSSDGPPATVKVSDNVLVDGSGRTLYLFEKDQGARSSCSGACADAWPPLVAHGALRAGSGVSKGLLGTTRRPDGTREVTYAGHPLYRYAGDEKPGDANGQGSDAFGAEWYQLDGSGKKVEEKKSSSSGGYGY